MIKIIEKGQKTFTRTCDKCGCKFQYDLSDLSDFSGLEYIWCPYCHTTLTHIGPNTNKIDLSKSNKIDFPSEIPCKVEVGDNRYNYATSTSSDPNSTVTVKASEVLKPTVLTSGTLTDTIYKNKLPDDIVDDPYNNVGMTLPDDVCINTLASM